MSGERSRTIALFPGAFRPPHVNHYETARHFASRPDVDEVVIIVSNRPRTIPGTALALDVDISRFVWQTYLRGVDGVRVEVAATTAVARTAELVRQGRRGDRFLLIFGAADLAAGRSRFGKILRNHPEDVHVEVAEGAPNVRPVRATDVRALLATENGFAPFCLALPDHVGTDDRRRIWSACREAAVDHTVLTADKIDEALSANGLVTVAPPKPVGTNPKPDRIYRVDLVDHGIVYIKYANDTRTDGATGGSDPRKPRGRLKIEREALTWLHRAIQPGVELPRPVLHDRRTRMLVLSAACENGAPLGVELTARRLDPHPEQAAATESAVASAAEFLAGVHNGPRPDRPFGDSDSDDRLRWQSALEARLSVIGAPTAEPDQDREIRWALTSLGHDSIAAAGPGFCHLDFTPWNVRFGDTGVAIVDFERSTSFGDPAFDLGTMLGHLVLLQSHSPTAGRQLTEIAVDAYRDRAGERWGTLAGRAARFAGATMLSATLDHTPDRMRPIARQLLLGERTLH